MEEAKAAIKDFTSRHGKHDTTVHEVHKPAVTHSHITPTEHNESTTVVDREVHQHHHHTSVQPVTHREMLPEKHHHKIIPVEHKEHHHGDHDAIKQRLSAEAAQFKDITETGKTERSHEVRPVVRGEHVHHHVHEVIQPIIQKETIQPTVIHTTIPIHEVHHNEPKHHAATALPAVAMEEFKKRGGSLTGRPEVTDRFDGEPGSETPEQHARHSGPHHHGFSSRDAASPTTGGSASRTVNGTSGHPTTNDTNRMTAAGVGGAANGISGHQTSHEPNRTTAANSTPIASEFTNGKSSNIQDRERTHHGSGIGSTAAGVGAAGAAAAETRHHDRSYGSADPRVDGTRKNSLEADRPVGARTTETAQYSNNLQREAPSQYADTHAGSKMDTAGDRNVGVASTVNGTKAINTNHHNSNFQAANVTKDTVPAADSSPESTKKRSSLLDRIIPGNH